MVEAGEGKDDIPGDGRLSCMDNPLWLCFCCGGLPLLGLLKGALLAPPTSIWATFVSFTSSVVSLPHNALNAARLLWSTPSLGPNVKVMLWLLWPVCVAM